MATAPGMSMPPLNLGLSFADTTHQSGAISNPVNFGGINFGRGTAGGVNSAANPSTNSDGGATAVTPVTSLPGFGGGGGGGGLEQFLPLLGSIPFQEGSMGLNGGQVQDPAATLALYNTLPKGVTKEQLANSPQTSMLPGPIALGAIVLALGVGAYFLLR